MNKTTLYATAWVDFTDTVLRKEARNKMYPLYDCISTKFKTAKPVNDVEARLVLPYRVQLLEGATRRAPGVLVMSVSGSEH